MRVINKREFVRRDVVGSSRGAESPNPKVKESPNPKVKESPNPKVKESPNPKVKWFSPVHLIVLVLVGAYFFGKAGGTKDDLFTLLMLCFVGGIFYFFYRVFFRGKNKSVVECVSNGQTLRLIENSITRGLDGKVLLGVVAEPCEVEIEANQITLNANSSIGFHANGRFASIYLSEPKVFEVSGNKIQLEQDVSFHENGMVEEGLLASSADFKVGDKTIHLDAGDEVYFHENGRFEYIYLSEPEVFEVSGNKIQLEQDVSFHENGIVSEGLLASSVDFKEGDKITHLDAGDDVEFDENGRLVKEF